MMILLADYLLELFFFGFAMHLTIISKIILYLLFQQTLSECFLYVRQYSEN